MARSKGMQSAVYDATERVFSKDPAELFGTLSGDGYSFFLDGGCGPAKLGRYSILGSRPDFVLRGKDCEIEVESEDGIERFVGNPLEELEKRLSEKKVSRKDGIPFVGGAVGYLSYDLGRLTEGVDFQSADDFGVPDLEFGFYDRTVVCDSLKGRIWVASCGESESECKEKSAELLEKLSSKEKSRKKTGRPVGREIESNFTKSEYLKAVGRVKDYIRAGDIYQVNLSQRFGVGFEGDCWSLYKKLRAINPAPFAAYLNFGGNTVLSSSPERFLKVDGRVIETRPIKGTRPRGGNPTEDKKLARELLASEKDKAEHVMIVDLERNDLGKVCEYGSVHVPEFEILESYSTVHHMVSTVEGRLRDGMGLIDCLRACFPGGSITGAPKVRAMEIIDELEPNRRGLYTGSIGYLGYDGRMDLNIAIRTMVRRGGRIVFGAGGGIVADSSPQMEYDETIDKARALFQSLDVIV